MKRRVFLKQAAAGIALPWIVPASALGLDGEVAPSNRLVGIAAGMGGRGFGDLQWLLGEKDVQFVAVCDVRRGNRERAKAEVDKTNGNTDCGCYRDFREMLQKHKADFALLAPGDRWHTPMSVLCMRAGMDVYCEKPGTITIAEGQLLVKTEQEKKRIFQTGAQRVSETNFRYVKEAIRLGLIGKVHTAWAHLGYMSEHPRVNATRPEEPLPDKEELDWDLWIGPAPMRPYNHEFVRPWPVPGWYTQYDFAGSIAQWGSHTILQAQHDLGLADTSAVEYTYPTDIQREGFTIRFANGIKIVAQEDGFAVRFAGGRSAEGLPDIWHGSCGVKYEGDKGWIACADGYERPDVSSPEILQGFGDFAKEIKALRQQGLTPSNHLRDFLDCVKTRKTPRTPATTAHRTMTTNLIMDICLDLKRSLKWDPVKEAFINDDEANRLRVRKSREPYAVS
ncbi:MAG: Gfo/Idh/MocA family oxidoreductase [Kiritimatiellaeota bacterium]|nr:Gfo/Idh/MocA family oxidoreductase [Kiritimatiellota bacterium]